MKAYDESLRHETLKSLTSSGAMNRGGCGLPGYFLSDGIDRAASPDATAARLRCPERFSYILRISPADPDYEHRVRLLAVASNGRAARVVVRAESSINALVNGFYADFFFAAGYPFAAMSLSRPHYRCLRCRTDRVGERLYRDRHRPPVDRRVVRLPRQSQYFS